jgi:hypothetical protein
VRGRYWRKRFKAYKKTEAALRAAIKGEDPNEIDKALEAYEGLKLGIKGALVEAAVKKRNELIAHASIKRALEQATKAKDLSLLTAAVQDADKNKVDPNHPILVTAKKLMLELQAYHSQRDKALNTRDINLVRLAVAQATKLALDGPSEKQLVALKQILEEEEGVKSKLQAAMQSRDIQALRNAIKVAMENKSGVMMASVLGRAADMGLQDDPLVKQAMALEQSLDKEISAGNVAKELQAAVKSGDYESLAAAVRNAHDVGLSGHGLTREAQSMMDKTQRSKQILADLNTGFQNKDEKLLVLCCEDAEKIGLTSAPEYQSAKQLLNEISSMKAKLIQAVQMKDAKMLGELVAKAEAIGIDAKELDTASSMNNNINNSKEVIAALQAGLASENGAVLEAAINKAKEKGMPINHPALQQAIEKLSELNASQRSNNADLVRAQRMRENRGSVAINRTRANGLDAAKVNSLFDKAKYQLPDYELQGWPGLRSANDFSTGAITLNKNKFKANMLRFSKDAIPKSLSELGNETDLMLKAVEIFKSIQGFMGDRHYSYPDTLVCEMIDDMLLWEELRDECYLQVLKQLSSNPKNDSDHRGWMLLSLLAEFVPPHEEYIPYVAHFIDRQAANPDNTRPYAHLYANYALFTLRETTGRFNYVAPQRKSPEFAAALARKDAGKHIPFVSVDHVSAFRERTMMPNTVKITLPDNSSFSIEIHPWERNSTVIKKLSEAIGMYDIEGLSLFEMRGSDLQYLYPHECLLDFARQWKKHEVKAQVVQQKKGFFAGLFAKKSAEEKKSEATDDWQLNTGMKRFLLKRRIFGKPLGESTDNTAMRLMYYQAAKEIALGWHNIEESPATTLAAVTKVIAENNSCPALANNTPSNDTADQFDLIQYWDCPVNLQARKVDSKKFAKNVEKIKPEIKAASIEAYLHEARKLNSFGSNFYRVGNTEENPLQLPDTLVIAVNYFGVFLLKEDTRELIDSYGLLNVLGWSSNSVRFVLKVKLNQTLGSGITTATFKFCTYNPRIGKEICDLLLTYANEMMKNVGLQAQQFK